MTKNWTITLLPALLVFWASCAGLTHHKDDAALSPVKKVAVVGFAVVEPYPPNFSFKEKHFPEIDQMYLGLAKAFDKLGWKTMPLAAMRTNPGYKKAYADTMEGFQNKMPVADKHRRLLVGEVMDNESLRVMGTEGRDNLMKALGVDALVTAQIDVLLSGTTVLGIGSMYPYANLQFQVYTRGKSTADWFEGAIEGEKAEKSIGSTALTLDVELMNRLALESARTAFAKIQK